MTATIQEPAADQVSGADIVPLQAMLSFAHAARTPKIAARGGAGGGTGTGTATAAIKHQTQLFEGGEHTYIGDNVWLQFADNVTMQAGSVLLRLENGLALTYGNILALGGDFYGVPKAPISDGQTAQARVERFTAAYATLAVAPGAVDEAMEILEVMNEEILAVNVACRAGRPPSDAYDMLGDSLSWKWNTITGGHGIVPGRYLKLAATNWDHFGQHAVLAYIAGHQLALDTALRAHAVEDQAEQARLLESAYAMNAFADHFLTDLFSSGHMRTPRKALYDCSSMRRELTGLIARYMHDEDSMWGLYVRNAVGVRWLAYGDKRYANNNDAQNMALVNQAAQASADEVYAVFASGAAPDEQAFAALQLIPDLGALQDRHDESNFAACYVVDPGDKVLARQHYKRLNDYRWTGAWNIAISLGKQKKIDHETPPPDGFLAAPERPPEISGWSTQETADPIWMDGNRVRYAVSFYNIRNESMNESLWGPWSENAVLDGNYMPELEVPIDETGEADGRRIYRQCNNGPAVCVGQVEGNEAAVFTDSENNEL